MRAERKRAILVALGLAAAAALLAYAFWPQPVLVDLATVDRGPLRVTVDEEGRTRVREVYVVSAPIAGRMARIEVHAGDEVVAGETVLATIRPTEPAFLDARGRAQAEAEVNAATAARALAEAEVDRAQAGLDFAEGELARAVQLAQRGTVSQSALDRAVLEARTRRAALAQAAASLEVRSYELATAKARLIEPQGNGGRDRAAECCVPVKAPRNGRILRVLQESEGVVAAGAPLLELGDPQDLEVVVELLSSDAVRVAEGAPVELVAWGGEAALPGRVRRIEPSGFTKVSALGIEEQRVNVLIDIAGAREQRRRLGHGFRVEARILVWRSDDVARLPLAALFREGADWAVFAAEEGRARLRRVEIGARNADAAELTAGLVPGARVVLHPSDRVADGVRVAARPGR